MAGWGKFQKGTKRQELLIRIISTLVLVPSVIFLIYKGGIFFLGFLVILTFLLGHEYECLTKLPRKSRGIFAAGVFATAFWVLTTTELQGFIDGMWMAAFLGGMAMVFGMVRRKPQMRWAGFGIPYIALPIFSLAYIEMVTGGPFWIFWVLLIVWASDTAGYAVGTLIGGPKLCPKISPNKTWAGFIGGIVLGALAGGLGGYFFELGAPLTLAFAGALLSVCGAVGDLAESYIKRCFKAKDSGKMIPGHGGLMDRADALMFIAPVVAIAFFVNA